MSYDRARGLNWNPLREGIEIDMMTKSDLVIDFMNNGPVSTHTFASSSSSLHPHIVIKKDVMSFDSILWDLYQFKRCTLQGWRHSVYSCPCPGRQSSNSWTSLSLFQFTYFQPGLAALRVVSSWTNLGPGLMKSSLKRSSETSGSWERSRWLIMPGVIDTQEGTSCEQNTGAD